MKKWYITAVAAFFMTASAMAAAVVLSNGETPDRPHRERAVRKHRMPAPAKAPIMSGSKQLYGAGNSSSYDGVFCFDPGPAALDFGGDHTRLESPSINVFSGCYFDGKFLSFVDTDMENGGDVIMTAYDAETWEPAGPSYTFTGTEIRVMPADLTYDPDTRKIYGVFFENYRDLFSSPLYFGYIDPMNISFDGPTKVADLSVEIRGIAANADGELFGFGNDDIIYRINKNTGALSEVVKFTMPVGEDWGEPEDPDEVGDPHDTFPRGVNSAEIDYDNPNKLYYAYVDGAFDGFIIAIDLTDGTVDKLYNSSYWSAGNGYSEYITALWFKQSVARAATTPNPVSNVSVGAVGTTLQAAVKFTLPSTDIEGNPIEGNVDWSVLVAGVELASGSATAGSEQTATVTVAEAAMTRFEVVASVGDTKSTSVSVSAFIGPDTPVLAYRPEAMADGRNVTVYWDAPYAANDGNLGELTYRVVRNPDNKVIADAATTLEVVDPVESEIKTLYSYSVTPIAGTVEGEAKTTRPLYVGDVFEFPYSDDFTDATLFAQYPVVDANKDGNTWEIMPEKSYAVYFSSTQEANDYLLIGPFDLVAGSTYNFEMNADGHNVPERVAAYVTDDVKKPSKIQIVEPTVCNPAFRAEHLTASYVPETSGRYYFSIHACSDANAGNLYIYDVKITGISHLAPGAPTDVKGVAGAADYTVTGTLPTLTADGKNPAGVTSVVVYRDGDKLAEVTEGVADGAAFSYTDSSEAANGSHTYSFAAVNAAGEGVVASVDGWRGPDTPGRPTDLRIWEDLNTPGIIHFTMNAPAAGIHGGYIDPNDLTYHVDYLSLQIGSGDVECGKSPEFTLTLPKESLGINAQIACSVYVTNSYGNSGRDGWNTKSVYVGPAKELPLRESWADGTQKSGIWIGQRVSEESDSFSALWTNSTGEQSGIEPQDGDGYMMSLTTYDENASFRIFTPRVTVADVDNPTMVFYYCYGPDATEFSLDIVVDDRPITTLKKYELTEDDQYTWLREEVSLAAYKGNKYIQLALTGASANVAADAICIDNVSIIDLKANDLSIMSGSASSKMIPNEIFEVNVNVRNSGSKDVDGADYAVVLNFGDREVARVNGADLLPDEVTGFTLSYTPTVVDKDNEVLTVKVEYDADMNVADNEWISKPVKLELNDWAAPRELTAVGGQNVTLHWLAPDMAEMPAERVTETFDSREAFSLTDLGGFTTYDGDGAPTVTIANALGVCNYPHIGEAMAWQVMDPQAAAILDGAWYAHSGNQFAVSFQACFAGTREKNSNDWLISPELNGLSQKIRFYARAGGRAYAPELLDVKYSTTDNKPESFIDVEANIEVPYASEWVEYNFTLPEGAKYFALVHKSFNKLALLVDDISYAPAGAAAPDIDLNGYNIYRDGIRLNTEPFAGTDYIDNTAEFGKEYTYVVSAVWSLGESKVSNPATAKVYSGIGDAVADGSNVAIYAERGAVRIVGAEGFDVSVVTPAGLKVAGVAAQSDDVRVSVAPGIYIVVAGTTTAKVVVF